MKKNLFLLTAILISGLTLKAQYPLLDFEDIQFIDNADLAVGSDLSYLNGDTVQVEGVVAMDPCNYALSGTSRKGTWLQDVPGAGWGGMEVLIDPGAIGYSGSLEDLSDDARFIDNFAEGNIVRVTGIVSDFSGNTQLQILPIPSTIQGLSSAPAPLAVTVDTFMVGGVMNKINGEKYEGTYVELSNVFVQNVIASSSDRWQWDISDGMGNTIAVRDVSGHFRNGTNDSHCPDWVSGTPGVSYTPTSFTPPAEGANLSFIRGTITESFGEYFIAPHDPADIGPATTSPPIVNNRMNDPVVPTSAETVTISADIFDADGTVISADLYYAYGLDNPTFTMVPMTAGSGDSWSASVPGPGVDSTYVKYYISAIDNSGNVTESPDAMATGSFYICYDDGINSIIRIQKNEDGFASVWDGMFIPTMSVQGTVTSGLQTYDLGMVTIQDGTAQWSGIFMDESDGLDELFRGDRIEITSAKVVDSFGVTYLKNATFTVLSSGNPLPDFITGLEPDTIDAGVFLKAEPYEGMLLRFDSAIVTENNADAPSGPFGEWRFNVGSSTPESGMRADDRSFDVPFDFGTDSVTLGETLGFVQGPLWFSFGNYKLIPRNLADIDGFNTDYPNSIVSFRFDALIPSVNASIDQDNLTIEATVPAGTDVTALVPTVEFTGQSVTPSSGAAQDFTGPVTYTSVAPVSEAEKEYIVTITVEVDTTGGTDAIDEIDGLRSLNLYPNPVSGGTLQVDIDLSTSDDLAIQISDLAGRAIRSYQIGNVFGRQIISLDVANFETGTYMVEIRGTSGTTSRRVTVIR